MLRNNKDQAFFGAPLVAFPSLGRDYVEWFCRHTGLPAPLDPAQVSELFARAAYRPEILGAAADVVRFDFALRAEDVPMRFARAVEEQITASNDETLRVLHSLTPLQSAVLRVMALAGASYAPFEAQTLRRCQAVIDTLAPGTSVRADVPNVQQALAALQDKALVWRAERGIYALEDAAVGQILAAAGMLEAVPTARPD